MKHVFIATCTVDNPNVKDVIYYIHKAGNSVILYEADDASAGRSALSISLEKKNQKLQVKWKGKIIRRESIDAAWYRRPMPLFARKNKLTELELSNEARRMQESLWSIVPDDRWFNIPDRIRKAEDKFAQLIIAKRLGFRVPATVVSNDWKDIRNILKLPLIMKVTNGLLYNGVNPKVLYTTVVDEQTIKKLRNANPFPGIFQEYIPKAKEWRITVVGDTVFSAAIYTTKHAKDDWRKHQHTSKVKFRKEEIEEKIQTQCIQFLKRFGLRFGAFDFIEDYDGRITFLECNPNGQFKWLESDLGLPISKAIASELMKIANGRDRSI